MLCDDTEWWRRRAVPTAFPCFLPCQRPRRVRWPPRPALCGSHHELRKVAPPPQISPDTVRPCNSPIQPSHGAPLPLPPPSIAAGEAKPAAPRPRSPQPSPQARCRRRTPRRRHERAVATRRTGDVICLLPTPAAFPAVFLFLLIDAGVFCVCVGGRLRPCTRGGRVKGGTDPAPHQSDPRTPRRTPPPRPRNHISTNTNTTTTTATTPPRRVPSPQPPHTHHHAHPAHPLPHTSWRCSGDPPAEANPIERDERAPWEVGRRVPTQKPTRCARTPAWPMGHHPTVCTYIQHRDTATLPACANRANRAHSARGRGCILGAGGTALTVSW